MAHEIRAGSFLMPIGAKLQDGKVNMRSCHTLASKCNEQSTSRRSFLRGSYVLMLLEAENHNNRRICNVCVPVCRQVIPEVLATYRKQLADSLL